MTTNSGFVITDAGNAAATVATPAGPFIHISSFKVGSAVNYIPQASDTGLHGTTLYTGGITNWNVVAYDTIELICVMDATVGPFKFGEIGIYLANGTLFALCTFSELQDKIRAVGVTVGTQWRIRARLKLAQASVVCQVDVITTQQVLEVPTWNLLVRPQNMVGNSNQVILTGEENVAGESIMVFKDTTDQWVINDFVKIFEANTSSGATIGTSVVSHADLANVAMVLPQTNSRYLIKFPDGDIRRVINTPGAGQLTFTPAKAVTQTGTFTVWEDAATACCKSRWADTYEYNRFVNLFNVHWSTPSGSHPGTNLGSNQTAIPTLAAGVHPTYNDWKALQDKVAAKCRVHNVAVADIVNMDYAYCENNSNGWGLQYIKECWDLFAAKIALLDTNRNVVDAAYMETATPSGATASRLTPWTGTKTHTITYTYASANAFKALVNDGHRINLLLSVATGANANWLDMKNFLSAMGTIIIDRSDTTVTGSGGTLSGLGLYELTGSYQQLYTRTASITGGTFTVTISGRITGGNVVDIKIETYNQATGYYASGVNDNFTSASTLRRAATAQLPTPAQAYPTCSSVFDY